MFAIDKALIDLVAKFLNDEVLATSPKVPFEALDGETRRILQRDALDLLNKVKASMVPHEDEKSLLDAALDGLNVTFSDKSWLNKEGLTWDDREVVAYANGVKND